MDYKSGYLAFLNRGFCAKARQADLQYNSAFSGVYDYSVPHDFGPLFAHFIDDLPEGGVVMCHPGRVDEILVTRDILTDQREKELVFLMSDEMPGILANAGVTLA